jgi:subfamily B ATP-binding cassette protein HlyB/CyaB
MRGDVRPGLSLRIAPADLFWALGSACNLQRMPFDASLLARAYPPPHTVGTLVDALQALGCHTEMLHRHVRELASMPMPCLVMLGTARESDEADARPALVVRADAERVLYFAAGANTPTVASHVEFSARHLGAVLRFQSPTPSAADIDAVVPQRFGFRWFVPEIMRHAKVWREVLLASLVLQLLALALPLLSQVIIDKVIVHRATSSLAVIAGALVAIVAFSSVIGWIRQYLVLHTGNRVDAVLGAAVFRHLLALPLRYFERRPTGVLTARLAGIETIRDFLTGAAVTLALDLPFLLVFLAIMLAYSMPLTVLTLGVVVLLVIASAVAAPLMQRRYDAQFLAAARNQAFVTEHLSAIETVKSLQLEASLRSRYDALLASYLDAGFRTRQLANTYQTVAGALEQLLSTTILCVGAWIVMTSTDFTIGMLVAFQMFAARVAQPLLRLAGLWQQFQQAAIAVRRLGDMMDVPAEPYAVSSSHASRGPGRIEFLDVGFRYTSETPWLHRQFTLTIEPGECIVLTGRSGQGKSTLLKLLLGFVQCTEGAVRIDGRDTRTSAANELRARFGVVPQDTTLFAGTLLENLQVANPLASFEQIVQACRLAQIHDTLEALPNGYRSEVGERGVGLSGGQKQRVALARALLRRPQVLLLDEPFSQLDEASAASVASALSALKRTLTIVIVSHQVPATLAADRRVELAS